jgi:hypothetical protein
MLFWVWLIASVGISAVLPAAGVWSEPGLPQVGVENSGKHTRSERTGNQALAALILMWSGPQDVAFYYNRNPQVTCFQQNEQQVDIMLVISECNQHGPRNERSGCGALKNSDTLSIDPYYPSADTEKHQCQGEHQPAITRRTIARRFRKVHMAQIQSATASTVISKDRFITVCLCLRDAQSIGTVTTKPQQSYPSTKVLKWL